MGLNSSKSAEEKNETSKKWCIRELKKIYTTADNNMKKKFEFLYDSVFSLNNQRELVSSRIDLCMVVKSISKCSDALERLMTGNDKNESTIPCAFSLEHCFNSALKEWIQQSIFFTKGIPEIQRIQNTACCYLHASIAMHYYLTNGQYGMIDLTKFILKSSSEVIKKYIRGEGGSSINVLENMLQENSKFEYMSSSESNENFIKIFDNYGPFLVSQFRVTEDFIKAVNGINYDFTETPTKSLSDQNPEEKHAMVIVGYRCMNEKLILLVQNWWRSCPFFITTRSFLDYHRALIVYCTTKQTVQRKNFSYNSCVYAEALDCPESYVPEDM
jgi:hypothetical protein